MEKKLTEAQLYKQFLQQNKERVEKMRESVQASELKARHWKAQVDTMVYSMEYETLLPEYEEHLKRVQEKEAEANQRLADQVKKNMEAGLEQTGVDFPVEETMELNQ